jgi:hypothetical protein
MPVRAIAHQDLSRALASDDAALALGMSPLPLGMWGDAQHGHPSWISSSVIGISSRMPQRTGLVEGLPPGARALLTPSPPGLWPSHRLFSCALCGGRGALRAYPQPAIIPCRFPGRLPARRHTALSNRLHHPRRAPRGRAGIPDRPSLIGNDDVGPLSAVSSKTSWMSLMSPSVEVSLRRRLPNDGA